MLNSRGADRLLFGWAVLRLPLLLLVALFFRQPIIDLALVVLNEGRATMLAIDVLSTPATRAIFAVGMVALLLLCAALTSGMRQSLAYFIVVGVGLTLMATGLKLTGKPIAYVLPGLILLATNLVPIDPKEPPTWPEDAIFLAGGSEGLICWRHLRRLRWLWTGIPYPLVFPRWIWPLPGAVLAAIVTAVLLGGHHLVRLEQSLRSPSTVRQIASGDYNWIQADKDHKHIFAVGHGFDRVQKFDLSDMRKPPIESDVSAGGPQDFAYSPVANEIYVLNTDTKQLLYLDAETLKLKRSVDAGMVSPGDPWIAADERTNTILLVSEEDEAVGSPLVLIDRTTGKVLDARNEDAGNLTLDPSRSLAYLSFFRRQSRVSVYDVNKRDIVRTASIGPHAERMALLKSSNELLVTLPPKSSIARLDTESLELKGNLKTEFGVRAIAIDTQDNLLFTGSIATGRIEIFDVKTLESRTKLYLGPWLRTIEVVPERGVAYVSSNGAIYEFKYK
ncbi:YncE family protein [Bradyrhizobium symbiodeficiens]|uniref:Uncharacterized protein n=1 Tax=Bradyrhizobium symbiodeficiens TaxID=1404367 RepID=A0A6G9A9B1_9BRAD|nr:hypothetical protein [Bradyrhizobium symbiodeficiens]QIP09040.1 hypothetical protein HAV00_23505 [Bradyrhizobium symbiodeficiens]